MANKGSKLSNIINKGNVVNAIVVLILFILIWGLIKSSKQINEIIHDRKNMAMVLAFASSAS